MQHIDEKPFILYNNILFYNVISFPVNALNLTLNNCQFIELMIYPYTDIVFLYEYMYAHVRAHALSHTNPIIFLLN